MVEAKKGTVVISLAGHDKGDFQVVINCYDGYVEVCDGKYRPLERVKRKNLKHVKVTNNEISEKNMLTNKLIRKSLKSFSKNI